MTKRSRSHELETRSQNAFKTLLPVEWSSSLQIGQDYGIDSEVTVFEDTKLLTTFKVQLKCSESKGELPPFGWALKKKHGRNTFILRI
jgi:hypothetical protein